MAITPATDTIDRGHERSNGDPIKPAHNVKGNDQIYIDNDSDAGK